MSPGLGRSSLALRAEKQKEIVKEREERRERSRWFWNCQMAARKWAFQKKICMGLKRPFSPLLKG